VKSCHRVEVDAAQVGPHGLVGDREWQLVTPDGVPLTQRQHPALARVHPTLVPDGVRLAAEGRPDLEVARPAAVDRDAVTGLGEVVRVADAGAEAAGWCTAFLGVPCRLTAIAPGYLRRLPAAIDLFGQDLSLADAAPVLAVTEASHSFLVERAREPFGVERFRPNLVVGGAEPWEEDTWEVLTAGPATLRGVLPWPRCAIPQVDQESGRRHREPAVVLRRYRWCTEAPTVPEFVRPLLSGHALFGLACSAGPEGAVIRVGDAVRVLSRGAPVLAAPR
jgi:uncharacterized protein YcbX